MKNVIVCSKEVGETPLERLEIERFSHGISVDIPMTYAGRLDPMAEGVLIILVGEECKKKEKYLGLNKEYEIEVLFGVKTDTGDVLGLIKNIDTDMTDVKKTEKINLCKYIGKFDQEYPKYSSKRIAKDFDEIEPKNVEIYLIENLGEREVRGLEIAENVITRVTKVKGDFRQKEIIEKWKEFEENYKEEKFKIIRIKVACSSGTYMRSLAERMGENTGTLGVAYSIKRISVGEYFLSL